MQERGHGLVQCLQQTLLGCAFVGVRIETAQLHRVSLGDFRNLAYSMLADAAMLRWLDGQTNTAKACPGMTSLCLNILAICLRPCVYGESWPSTARLERAGGPHRVGQVHKRVAVTLGGRNPGQGAQRRFNTQP